MKEQGFRIKHIEKDLLHVLTRSSFFSIYNIIMYAPSKELPLRYLDTCMEYDIAGWEAVLRVE
jgi:hypothetical protein